MSADWLTTGGKAVAAAAAEAAKAAAAKEKERREAIGVLKNRPATIPRGPEELNEILTGYLDQKLTPSDKKKNKSAEEQRLSKRMYEASERMRPSAIPRASSGRGRGVRRSWRAPRVRSWVG